LARPPPDTVHLRHQDIEEHGIDFLFTQLSQGSCAVLHDNYGIASLFQMRLAYRPDKRIIVHDHDNRWIILHDPSPYPETLA
jgi:hypothetical protein